MNKEEAKEALIQASRIVDQWEKNELESYEAMEMIAPLLKTITVHVENVLQDPAASEAASLEKEKEKEESEAASHLPEKEKEKEELLSKEEGDLFSKTEDLESKDESKSKSKKRKFAGSNGEIPF